MSTTASSGTFRTFSEYVIRNVGDMGTVANYGVPEMVIKSVEIVNQFI